MICAPTPRGFTFLSVAQLTYKLDVGPRESLRTRPNPHQLRYYLPNSITQPEQATLWDLNKQYKDPLLPIHGLFLGLCKAPTRRPSGACYYSVTHSWTTWFTDPATLSNHLHVLNIVTPLINAGSYEWWHISLHRIIKRRDLDSYKEIITCGSCSYRALRYPQPWRQLKRVIILLIFYREWGRGFYWKL